MEVKEVFNTTREAIESKSHNILVPICLGNKFFTINNEATDNIRKYVEWALRNTKEKVLVLVVDKIQDTNYYVRNGSRSEAACRRKVMKDGEKVVESIKNMLFANFSPEQRSKIDLIRYEDYENSDPYCLKITKRIHEEFRNNISFGNEVLKAVKESIKDRTFSEEEYLKLCNYVLDEFCLVYTGLDYKGDYYGLYVYPETDSVVYFIDDIQNARTFQELNAELPTRKMGLAILNE